jgi:hypothetical protein
LRELVPALHLNLVNTIFNFSSWYMALDHFACLRTPITQVLSSATVVEDVFHSSGSVMLEEKAHGFEVESFMIANNRLYERVGVADHVCCSVNGGHGLYGMKLEFQHP